MRKKDRITVMWVARMLAILYILFISMFVFDSFSPDIPLWQVLISFLIHLIPSFILIFATVTAWKNEFLGGVLFLVIGVVFTLLFNTYEDIFSFVLLSGPNYFIGTLFLLYKFAK